MAIVNGYCTRGEFTSELDSSGNASLNNTRVDQIAYQASRTIDGWTARQFYPTIETRYFTGRYRRFFVVDDLLSVTTLKVDTTGDRTYDTTWAAADYDLEPYNALDMNNPYRQISLTPQATNVITRFSKGIEIAGKWGFFEVTVASGSLLDGAISDTTTTSVVVDNEADFSVGHIIVVDSEYMRVDAVTSDSSHTLTVVRGINGSTAATHTDNTIVNILDFPVIKQATLRLATRMWHLRAAPMGIATAGVLGLGGSTGGTRWIQEDKDLAGWLAPYMVGKVL